ncbi:MAG: hypothetical protein V5A46_10635 [Haloferacaceae archaeon]
MNGTTAGKTGKRRGRLVETTRQLLSFDTQNPPGETPAAMEWVHEYASEFDVETEWIVQDPERPNLVVTLPGDADRTLLYEGHLDTVPFDGDAWSVDPHAIGEYVEVEALERTAEWYRRLPGLFTTITADREDN